MISGSIGLALGIVILIQDSSFGWIARYIDQILVIVFCLAFLKDPYLLVKNGFRELLLSAPDDSIKAPLKKQLSSLEEHKYFTITDITLIKTGRRVWVSYTIVNKNDDISLQEFFDYREVLNNCAYQCYNNCHSEVVLEQNTRCL